MDFTILPGEDRVSRGVYDPVRGISAIGTRDMREQRGSSATYDGGPLFRAQVCVWIWRKLAVSKGLEFSRLYAKSLLVIGR